MAQDQYPLDTDTVKDALADELRERHPALSELEARDIVSLILCSAGLTRMGRIGIIPEVAATLTKEPEL